MNAFQRSAIIAASAADGCEQEFDTHGRWCASRGVENDSEAGAQARFLRVYAEIAAGESGEFTSPRAVAVCVRAAERAQTRIFSVPVPAADCGAVWRRYEPGYRRSNY